MLGIVYIWKGVVVLININDLKTLMLQFTEPLIRLAYYYVKDLQLAEDIVQEVLIEIGYPNPYEFQ